MNPRSPDPNNPVPEIFPVEGWEDAAESAPQATVLPPRRAAADRAANSSSDHASTGLRIDSQVQRTPSSESPQRIEVQELNSPVLRLDPATPAPPKVARQVTFRERPTREKDNSNSSGESSTWGAARKLPKLWIVGSGVGVLAIIILFLALLPAINSLNAKKKSNITTVALPLPEETIEPFDPLDLLLTKQPEATKIYQAYLTATRVEEVIPLIRDGKALEPTLRAHWHPSGISKRWVPPADCSWSLKKIADHPCGFLNGTLPDQSQFLAYFTNDDNQLRLDWKATSAFSTATFAELDQGTGDSSEIRAAICLAQFYTASWPETDYQSYRLTSPDGLDILWCYGRRNEPAHQALGALFRKDLMISDTTYSWKVTLRLARGPADSLPNQWLIGEVLHIDWINP